jgi:hypothetical protein
MKCRSCQSDIARGLEERKRAEAHQVPGRGLTVFGAGMPGGALAQASGPLVWAKHAKCYWADENRRTRGAQAASRTLQAKQDERSADPGYQPRREQDWRDPETYEIEDLLDGHGNGTAG